MHPDKRHDFEQSRVLCRRIGLQFFPQAIVLGRVIEAVDGENVRIPLCGRPPIELAERPGDSSAQHGAINKEFPLIYRPRPRPRKQHRR